MRRPTIFAILAVILIFCGESYGSITRRTVEAAWSRITRADGFRKIPIIYDNDPEPNAYVYFQDEDKFTFHVTLGLLRILGTEDEIAGVLGHEIGHVRLGHYAYMLLTDAASTIMNANSDGIDTLALEIGKINTDRTFEKVS